MIHGYLRRTSKKLALRSAPEAALHAVRSLLDRIRLGADARVPLPRGPYLQDVTTTSAVIVWATDRPNVGAVEYGETPRLGHRAFDPSVAMDHAVALTNLSPGTAHHYRVTEIGGVAVEGTFRTAPATGGDAPFSFAVVGDSGDGGKGQLAVAALLERLRPGLDLVLHTGDVVYPSGEDRHYDERFFRPYRELLKDVPVYPVLGNHDVERINGAAYLKNFHPPRNDPRGSGRYYSFDWGNAHFVALDSELYHDDGGGDKEEQRAWLERDLAGTRQPWKFVHFHRPMYSSSNHGGDARIREDLEPVFVRHGVDIVFNGHDHDYERTVHIGGVVHVVTGGGGKQLYPARKSAWTACSKSIHHAVVVRVEGRRLSLEAVTPDGKVADHAHLEKAPRLRI